MTTPEPEPETTEKRRLFGRRSTDAPGATRTTAPSGPVVPPTATPAQGTPAQGTPAQGRPAQGTPAPGRRVPAAAQTERSARRELARAARARKRFEKDEVKRFTRRSRSRRTVWLSVGGVFVVLGALLAVAVFSPLLALRTVQVDGASRVSAAEVQEAVESQLGTSLALIDYGTITDQLAKFPLIRSYVTELVPPNTLVIHLVERAPVGAVVNGAEFELLDPAGIVVQTSETRPEGVPLIDVGTEDADSVAYRSVVEVLLSLPAELLAQVDTISATTKDNVTFSLRGVGQTVVWGSSDRSDYKASVLAGIVAQQEPDALVEFDVSAPGSVVVTPR
ncbi:cell division protein FtsQ [Conyzicola lurida]|uniref:Cell division protein FtsQ n=1 Tax=Conyzicola lurida TaxID=1172621 RepID=A0A841AGK3_9MICO|nr:cell division protein FtsQ [Conyzicola lurida]